MKTNMIQIATTLTFVVALTILSSPIRLSASEIPASPKGKEMTDDKTANDSLPIQAYMNVEATTKAISRWIGNAISKEFGSYELESDTYKATVKMVINGDGILENYSIVNAPNSELEKMIASVVAKAPNFGPFKNCNSNVKFTFNIPLTFIVR